MQMLTNYCALYAYYLFVLGITKFVVAVSDTVTRHELLITNNAVIGKKKKKQNG